MASLQLLLETKRQPTENEENAKTVQGQSPTAVRNSSLQSHSCQIFSMQHRYSTKLPQYAPNRRLPFFFCKENDDFYFLAVQVLCSYPISFFPSIHSFILLFMCTIFLSTLKLFLQNQQAYVSSPHLFNLISSTPFPWAFSDMDKGTGIMEGKN